MYVTRAWSQSSFIGGAWFEPRQCKFKAPTRNHSAIPPPLKDRCSSKLSLFLNRLVSNFDLGQII